MDTSYQAEVPLKIEWKANDYVLVVEGRADGIAYGKFQRYFRLVGGVHAFLNFPVDTAAFHHGLCTRQLSGTIIDISCPENKLYQISHRYM